MQNIKGFLFLACFSVRLSQKANLTWPLTYRNEQYAQLVHFEDYSSITQMVWVTQSV